MKAPAHASAASIEAPLPAFSRCHAGIVEALAASAELPRLLEAAAQARSRAAALLRLFEDVVLPHHADEERDLFPAVQRSARPGREGDHVAQMGERLVREHRKIEAKWAALRAPVRRAAAGGIEPLDAELLAGLVEAYLGHARFEEEHFLPLAHEILARDPNHMSALGLALHLAHAPMPLAHV